MFVGPIDGDPLDRETYTYSSLVLYNACSGQSNLVKYINFYWTSCNDIIFLIIKLLRDRKK
jgi:hypothetical protein